MWMKELCRMLIASLICGCWRAAVVPCSSAGISYQWAWSRSQATLLWEKVVKEIMAYMRKSTNTNCKWWPYFEQAWNICWSDFWHRMHRISNGGLKPNMNRFAAEITWPQSARLRRAGGLGGITRRPHSSTGGRGPRHVGGNVTGMWWPAGSTCGDTLTSSDLALHINYVYILVVNVAYILTPAAHWVPVCLSHSVDMRCQGSIGQMADRWAGGMPIITTSIS